MLKAPEWFFTENSLGVVLNRFSLDVGNVDELLSVALFETLQLGFLCLGALATACAAVPWLLLGAFPLLRVFLFYRQYETPALTEVGRERGATTRAPRRSGCRMGSTTGASATPCSTSSPRRSSSCCGARCESASRPSARSRSSSTKTTTMKRRRIAHGTREFNCVRYACTASHL